MYLLPILFFFFFFSIPITISEYIIRGEKTRYSISCPTLDAIWYGPTNDSIISNTNKYELKYLFDKVQLTINDLTSIDEGEYQCKTNETNLILVQYELKIATIEYVLLPFFILSLSILIFIPIIWFLGKKYSGILIN